MRVTRETLIRIAKETAQERAYNDRGVIAAYLAGSLQSEEQPFLGGTTDIDLVFVTAARPPIRREIVKLTPDFHLDIIYHAKAEYNPARALRVDPWLGHEIYDPLLLYEREHFFEFTQAAVRAGFEFHEPEFVLGRCRKLLDEARKIWLDLMDVGENAGPIQVAQYLRALYHAVNAVAELNGPPLPERRLLLLFPARAEAAERPGMAAGLIALLGGSGLQAETLTGWLDGWQSAFQAAAEHPKADASLHPARLNYYRKAFEAMLGADDPLAALWPLLHTWTLAARVLPAGQNKPWGAACERLGLAGASFAERVQGLDHLLDEIEILLDEIAEAHGLETSTSL